MDFALPKFPLMVFMSGDVAFMLPGNVPLVRHGKEYIKIWMILTPETIARYRINESDIRSGGDLDHSITEYGAFSREYPKDHIIDLSKLIPWYGDMAKQMKIEHMVTLADNPGYPVYLIMCNFDGTTILCDNLLVNLSNRIVNQQHELRIRDQEAQKLRESLKAANDRLKKSDM